MVDVFKQILVGVLTLVTTAVNTQIPINTQDAEGDGNPPAIQDQQYNHAPIQDVSVNWAGYASKNGPFTGVGGKWTVPHNSPDASFGADATWVGIGGVRYTDLIQAGTQRITTRNGHTSYRAFYEMLPDYPQDMGVDISPGDSVTVSINETSKDNWNISFTNNTTNESKQIDVNYKSSLSSAEWIQEAPSTERGVLPLGDFGIVHFSEGWAIQKGEVVNVKESKAQPIALAWGDEVLANASEIGHDGSSFSVTNTENQSSSEWESEDSDGESFKIPDWITIYLYGQ